MKNFPFILGIRATGTYAIKLRRPGDDIVATVADLRRPEIWIEIGGMRRGGIFERAVNDSVSNMARGAG
jgi:hypothetical protein